MEYTVEAVQQEGLRFLVTSGPHTLTTDYPLDPSASGAGPRPLEMLLGSLAACAGGALIALLRRSGQPFKRVQVRARGQRRSEHPTVFTQIALEFVVHGPVEPTAVAQAIEQSEARLCPIWAMLKPGTPIASSYRVEP